MLYENDPSHSKGRGGKEACSRKEKISIKKGKKVAEGKKKGPTQDDATIRGI